MSSYVSETLARPFDIQPQSNITKVGDPHDLLVQNQKKRPKFHLLIPSTKPSANLCKTLLSAAVLDYPPPTLLNYNGTEENNPSGTAAFHKIVDYISSFDVHDKDIVLVVEENTWFQLPAPLLIKLFDSHRKQSDVLLAKKYGLIEEERRSRTSGPQRFPKFTEKVIFGASKVCPSNDRDKSARYAVPHSTVPQDTDTQSKAEPSSTSESRNLRPYIEAGTFIGQVSDLRPIFSHVAEKLKVNQRKPLERQSSFSEMFGKQEYKRKEYLKSHQTAISRWIEWLGGKVGMSDKSTPKPSETFDLTTDEDQEYEFGIGIDYASQLFLSMKEKHDDVTVTQFGDASLDGNAATTAASSAHPLNNLPVGFIDVNSPFKQNIEPDSEARPLRSRIDDLPDELSWSDIPLVTTSYKSGNNVPALLYFSNDEFLMNGWWAKMWYQPHARALLRRYLRSSQGPSAAEAAAEGGGRWWDLRGGKGGVWTDRDEWLEWNEVCSGFEDEIFGDNMGAIGEEEGADAPVYNSFGLLMSGKGKGHQH